MLKKFLLWWRQRDFHQLQKKKVEDIFSEIYSKNTWGGKPGEFYSGSGTHNPDVQRYIDTVRAFIKEKNIRSVLEIGCGDFHISSQIIEGLNVTYTGTDVVEEMMKHHQGKFGRAGISFRYLNAIDDQLPPSDMVIIRQVLQHLGNAQISNILDKIQSFRYALITEHLPASEKPDYNVDKIPGPHIRMKFNSGVFIDKPPFNVRNTSVLLEYQHDDVIQKRIVPAVMRTYLVESRV